MSYIMIFIAAIFVNNIFAPFNINDLKVSTPDHNYVRNLFSEVNNFFYQLLLTAL